jgi:hypothetical protein
MTQSNVAGFLETSPMHLFCGCLGILGISAVVAMTSPGLFASEVGTSRMEAAGQQQSWPTESVVFAVPSASEVFGSGATRSRSTESTDYEKYLVDGHIQQF